MKPADLGLPARFVEFREGQLEAAVALAASDSRFVIDSQPTGAGKSIIYTAAARMLEYRTMVLTANKGLQLQLSNDFSVIGMTDVRGQSNYPCVALAHRKGYHGCDKGPCHFGAECELHPRHPSYHQGCAFYDQIGNIRRSRLCVTNYDFWLSAHRYMDPDVLGRFDLLVLDEAHDAPDKLAEFCTVTINKDECEEFLNTGLPPVEDGTEAWVSWALTHFEIIVRQVEHAKMFMGDDTDTIKRMSDLAGKLSFLTTAQVWRHGELTDPEISMPGKANDWVGERAFDGDSVTFSPVWAHKYAEQWLFASIPHVFMVSATILPRTAHYLGIDESRYDYHDHTSSFHVDRRPVFLVPCASISKKSSDVELRAQMVKIDQIIGARLDRKGIIHAHSYDRAYQIRMSSQHKHRMVWHKRGDVARAVEEFRHARPGTVLISPSIEQGFDFPYTDCEYQIIPKVPFPDTRSAVMKARIRSDKKYQNYITVLALVQMAGRAMRAKDDSCETFILDDNIFWFRKAAHLLIPKWFRAAVKVVSQLPTPLPKLTRR